MASVAGMRAAVQASSSAVRPNCTARAPSAIKSVAWVPACGRRVRVRYRLADHSHQAVRLTQNARFGIGGEGELRNLHFALPAGPRLRFRKSDAGDFRPSENDIGHRPIVDLPLPTCRTLGSDPPFHHRLVREHPNRRPRRQSRTRRADWFADVHRPQLRGHEQRRLVPSPHRRCSVGDLSR